MINKNRVISVFSDFDATISLVDVGDNLFRTFGSWDTIYKDYKSGEIDCITLNKLLCNSLRNDLTFEEISQFAIEHEIDPYFSYFTGFLKQNNIELTVVSDGYDAYIEPILRHNNLSFLPLYCNKLIKNKDNTFEPIFFCVVESCCFVSSASCKRNVLLNNFIDEDRDIIIYIGDGRTDTCAAEHSDIIFAKGYLAAYCNEKRIPHYPFKSFFDIYRILSNKIKNNDLRQRHQAKMKRKSAFEIE